MKLTRTTTLTALLVAFSLSATVAAEVIAPVEPNPETAVHVMRLSRNAGRAQKHYFGTVQGSQRVNLSFRVAGPLIEFPIEMGAQLKKGDLIGRIDPRDFRTRLTDAQSQLSQARAKFSQANNDFKRHSELYKNKVISQSQYDRYKTAYDVAASNVKTAEANVAAAQNALTDTELRAPFNGVIIARMAENFQDVQAKQPVASLQNLETVEIVMDVSEEDVATVAVSEKDRAFRIPENIDLNLEATLDALPGQSFKVTMKEVGAQSDPRTKTYPVTVTMPQPDSNRILPGMTVNITADIPVSEPTGEGSFYVPLTALVGDVSKNVWLWRCKRDWAVEKVPVVAGIFRGEYIMVSGDLHPGDIIVTAGARGLVDDQKVYSID